jgi:hypothetical protein
MGSNKIKIKKVNDEVTIEIDLDSGLSYVADIIVHAKVTDGGIGHYEFHGVQGFDRYKAWELDRVEVLRCDVYCPDFDCFARLPDSDLQLVANKIEHMIEIDAELPDYDYE